MDKRTLCQYIDHTLLKAEATPDDIKKICDEAKEMGFMAVCVNSAYAELAAAELKGSGVKTAVTTGFPLGMMVTAAKAYESKLAAEAGADEIDTVINIGRLKAGDYDYVLDDLQAVVNATGTAKVKVIIEAGMLTEGEIIKACELSVKAGAAFVKTSTGMLGSGATVEAVRLMRKTVGPKIGVKASGGVRSMLDVENMIAAGATRIGTSSGYQLALEAE